MEYTDIHGATELTSYRLTHEQKHAIKELFTAKGWKYEEITIASENISECNDFDPDKFEPGYVVKKDECAVECPFCYCSPCVTHENNRQAWWLHNPQPPNILNSKSRKKCFKSFWTMLYHRRAWLDPRYVNKKQTARGIDARHNRYEWHRRDIMPNCVLKLVRTWYPNPKDIPYMGHMWE